MPPKRAKFQRGSGKHSNMYSDTLSRVMAIISYRAFEEFLSVFVRRDHGSQLYKYQTVNNDWSREKFCESWRRWILLASVDRECRTNIKGAFNNVIRIMHAQHMDQEIAYDKKYAETILHIQQTMPELSQGDRDKRTRSQIGSGRLIHPNHKHTHTHTSESFRKITPDLPLPELLIRTQSD